MNNGALVLNYHKIGIPVKGTRMRSLYVPTWIIDSHLEYLKKKRFNVVPLKTIVSMIKNRKDIPRKTVAITFDDGSSSLYEYGINIFKKYKFPITVFLLAGLIGKKNYWDKAKGEKSDSLLNYEQIKELQKHNVEFGSHGLTHKPLASIPAGEAEKEIRDSKKKLEDLLNQEVRLFAYPYGEYNKQIVDMVKNHGYEGACSTEKGLNDAGTDPYLIRRLGSRAIEYLPLFIHKIRKYSKCQKI